MTFSAPVLFICVAALFLLAAYTAFLLRKGKLTPQVTMRWLLASIVSIAAVLFWGRLPFISFTANLNDREMLVVLTIIIFVFFSFLILECLSIISKHTNQIRRLTQEIALMKAQNGTAPSHQLQAGRPREFTTPSQAEPDNATIKSKAKTKLSVSAQDVLLFLWIALWVGLYVCQDCFPACIKEMLTANYKG